MAATDASDIKASFSNYGSWVDISAPGEDILSSYHVHSQPASDYVATLDGTSMAAPIAAGIAALIWSANPSLTADQVRQILFNGADNIDALNPAYAGLLGVGRVNAFAPLLDPSLPVELAAFTARYDSGQVILDWETMSELDNIGFEISRSPGEEEPYHLIASYQYHPSLQGLGNSTVGRTYQYADREIIPGFLYRYLLYDVAVNGQRTAHGPVHIDLREGSNQQMINSGIADDFELFPNWPNPFNPLTRIAYRLNKPVRVSLIIYNTLGQEVIALVNDDQAAGWYQVQWDGRDSKGQPMVSGLYIVQLTTGTHRQAHKMMLLR